MGSKTATVETLTAEVRVLMVGSRQVTLSVARQLDEVEPDEIKPFGRIRTGKRRPFAARSMIEVIGANHGPGCTLGALVLSSLAVILHRCGESPGQRLGFNGRDCIGGYCPEYPQGSECTRGHFWADDGDHGIWAEWCELPLIVLAGLR